MSVKVCFHEDVCKHLINLTGEVDAPPCPITTICKHHVAPEIEKVTRPYKKRAYKPRTYKKRVKYNKAPGPIESKITKKQINKAKKKIMNAKRNKGISDNQDAAFNALKGIRFKNLTDSMKEQIIGIANDIKDQREVIK